MPIPKNRRIRKIIMPVDAIKPRLVLANKKDRVNSKAKYTVKKNKPTTPGVIGLVKYIIRPTIPQRARVNIKVGKKFFLLCLFFLFLLVNFLLL